MHLFLGWAVSLALVARAVVHRGFRRGAVAGSALITLGRLVLVGGGGPPGCDLRPETRDPGRSEH
jgi:hypothetical protein